MSKATAKKESIVKPIISVAGETHPLESILAKDTSKLPEIKSVGYMRVSANSNSWVSYTITSKGDKIISIEVDEPNLRQIAEESAKISFVNSFSDQE
jgi:pheromone shutdown protein TraB